MHHTRHGPVAGLWGLWVLLCWLGVYAACRYWALSWYPLYSLSSRLRPDTSKLRRLGGA